MRRTFGLHFSGLCPELPFSLKLSNVVMKCVPICREKLETMILEPFFCRSLKVLTAEWRVVREVSGQVQEFERVGGHTRVGEVEGEVSRFAKGNCT